MDQNLSESEDRIIRRLAEGGDREESHDQLIDQVIRQKLTLAEAQMLVGQVKMAEFTDRLMEQCVYVAMGNLLNPEGPSTISFKGLKEKWNERRRRKV